jgi:hypothetical protein
VLPRSAEIRLDGMRRSLVDTGTPRGTYICVFAFLRFCVVRSEGGGGWLGGCSFSDAGGQTTMTPEEGGEVCGDLSVYAFRHPSPPPSILSITFYHKFLRHLWALL